MKFGIEGLNLLLLSIVNFTKIGESYTLLRVLNEFVDLFGYNLV